MKINDDIKRLFTRVKTALGAPIRNVQLTDDMLCSLLEMSIEDYGEKVQNWLVENQWATLYGKNVSNTDMAFALSVRTMDMMKDYSSWFSKQVGLQQYGQWELKKDFIEIVPGQQCYIVPAGREINKVMYVTPPVTQAALFANYGGIDIGFGGGYAQLGGGAYGPMGGFFTAPAADVAYLSTDLTYKNRLLRSDLTYKVTAGPNGTKIIHLLSTPGSKLSFGYGGGGLGSINMIGSHVWYTYYDVSGDDVDECRMQNPDILLTPDQVPLNSIDYAYLNDPTKTIVRQLLVAKAKETLGIIRGTNSGKVSIPQAELTLDYNMLLQQGKEEYLRTMDNLEKRLERMNPVNVMENQAKITESTRQVLSGVPLKIYTI